MTVTAGTVTLELVDELLLTVTFVFEIALLLQLTLERYVIAGS